MNYYRSYYESPIGRLPLIAGENALIAVLWENDNPERVSLPDNLRDEENEVLVQTRKQLSEYFAGNRKVFDLPLQMNGTPFQQSIWQQLQKIPFGETRSYGQLAKHIGQPTASRAVGAANGKNPISIIVPCHRVIGTGGKLTGFAGGIEAKEFLLRLEGKLNLF
ncbi:MAG: methylated-DNA--[protein]-cysteine S-methyltransferase [Bacteroidia bacterium]|jgi:methylated-DNA-[protein]-cysteine S-methyltransferase|nr:methylated-DNA--[protein]-cysteine S-methyltransferase [Bacteroidia bacterium]